MSRRTRTVCRCTLIIALATLATAPLWLPAVGIFLVVADPLAPADAIVPLAGGDDRAHYAAALWREGYARWLVASDIKVVAPLGRLGSALNADLAAADGVAPWQIYATDRIVSSTYTELQAIRDLARRQGWHSLIIVTSPQHTRRTRLMADDIFADGSIRVIVRPVEGYGYNPARWWRNEEERRLTLIEYAKLTAFLAGYRGR